MLRSILWFNSQPPKPNQNAASAVSVMFCYGYRNITLADSPPYTFTSVVEINVETRFVWPHDVAPLIPSATMTAPSEPLPLVVSLFLRQGLGGLMPAEIPYITRWIDTPVAHRRLAVSLTDDLNRCLRAVSLRNLSWTAVVDLSLPGLGLFFTESVWINFDLILNTVALCTPACIAAWFAVAQFSNIPITRALTSTEMLLPSILNWLLWEWSFAKIARLVRRKITCKHATLLNMRQCARANAVFCSVSYKCNFCIAIPMHKTRSVRLTAQIIRILKCAKFAKLVILSNTIYIFNWNKAIRKMLGLTAESQYFFPIVY